MSDTPDPNAGMEALLAEILSELKALNEMVHSLAHYLIVNP